MKSQFITQMSIVTHFAKKTQSRKESIAHLYVETLRLGYQEKQIPT